MKAATPMKMRTRGTTTPAIMRAVFLLDAALIGVEEGGVVVGLAASEGIGNELEMKVGVVFMGVEVLLESVVEADEVLVDLGGGSGEEVGVRVGVGVGVLVDICIAVTLESGDGMAAPPPAPGPGPVGFSVGAGAVVTTCKLGSSLVLFKLSSNKTCKSCPLTPKRRFQWLPTRRKRMEAS
jgi:hypothetical protein